MPWRNVAQPWEITIERLGVQGQGTHAIATAALLAEIAGLVADGSLEIPIARTFPLEKARDAPPAG